MVSYYLDTEYGKLYPYSINEYTQMINGEKTEGIEVVYSAEQDMPEIPTPFMAKYVCSDPTVGVIGIITVSRIRREYA